VRLKPTASAAAIEKAVRRVLEPRYAEGARRMRDAIAREAKEIDAASVLEEIAPPATARRAAAT
jgi:UDP:flavonoid glycosyltransferase YjiC (YdhE family)